jgi:hypothetical protein
MVPLSPQQPVVEQPWVVDSIRIHDQRPHQTAQLNQVMPVAAIARQARSFDTEDGAHAAGTHLGNQAGKPRTVNLARTGPSKILVNDLDLLEAKLASLVS